MKLTKEQEQYYEQFKKEWESIGFATDKANFDEAEESIKRLYKYTGESTPNFSFRLTSPFAATIAINIYHNERLRLEIGRQIGLYGISADDYLKHVEKFVDAVLADFIAIKNEQQPFYPAGDTGVAVSSKSKELYDIFLKGKVSVLPVSYGSASSYWAAWYLWAQYLGVQYGDHEELLHILVELCKHAGWVWLFDKSYIMTDKPSEIHLDEQDRFHNDSGPAIGWRDGSAIYQIHGIEVSAKVVYNRFTAEDVIKEQNAEVRRIMVDKFGAGNYLKAVNAKRVSVDDYGILYELPEDRETRIVEVINSTNEFDGTAKIYHLIVPATMQTAHEAVARSFGLEPEDYHPSAQS